MLGPSFSSPPNTWCFPFSFLLSLSTFQSQGLVEQKVRSATNLINFLFFWFVLFLFSSKAKWKKKCPFEGASPALCMLLSNSLVDLLVELHQRGNCTYPCTLLSAGCGQTCPAPDSHSEISYSEISHSGDCHMLVTLKVHWIKNLWVCFVYQQYFYSLHTTFLLKMILVLP